jgi:hypothetical protein
MILLRLLGLGAIYGLGFALVKTLFPSPIILMTLSGGSSSEGNLTFLALVYMGVGLIAGLVVTPIFGVYLMARRRAAGGEQTASFAPRFTLSLFLSLLMGVVSGVLTIAAYGTGLLPPGGVLDPLELVRNSNFSPGTPLLYAWTIARDLLPAGLVGLFLAPIGGGLLARLRGVDGPPVQRSYEEFEG